MKICFSVNKHTYLYVLPMLLEDAKIGEKKMIEYL